MEDKEQYQDSIFEQIMPLLDEYVKTKLKLQQLKQSGEKLYSVRQDYYHNIQHYANKIKEILTEDAEMQYANT